MLPVLEVVHLVDGCTQRCRRHCAAKVAGSGGGGGIAAPSGQPLRAPDVSGATQWHCKSELVFAYQCILACVVRQSLCSAAGPGQQMLPEVPVLSRCWATLSASLNYW